MGFKLVRNRKNNNHGQDDVHLVSNTKGGAMTEAKLPMSRRNKILSKMLPRRSKSRANMEPSPAETPGTNAMTPSWILQDERQWVTDRAVEVAIPDDSLDESGYATQSVLDEREFIRQQLFYEEHGVEVAAQFSPSPNGTSRTTLYPASIQKQQQPPQRLLYEPPSPQSSSNSHSHNYDRHEEKKEEETEAPFSTLVNHHQTPAAATHKISVVSPTETPLPPTPVMEPSDVDPLKHFPAVALAVAKAEASRPRAPGVPIVTRTGSNSASDFSAFATTTPHQNIKQQTVVTPPTPSPEKPFDEYDGPEDPTIVEMEQNEKTSTHDPAKITAAAGTEEDDDPRSTDITRKLLDSFACGGVGSGTVAGTTGGGDDFTEFSGNIRSCRLVDAFYDNSCWTYREAAAIKRPYYDERFAERFLKDITEEGVNVLWHLPPPDSSEEDPNWSGTSVVMQIKPGSCYSTNDVEPKLQWNSLSGGRRNHSSFRSIPLLDIQSIATFNDTIYEGEEGEAEMFMNACGGGMEEDVCLFAITTDVGDVHVFEATSSRERDLLVAGLKNVIARLSFHMIVGDAGASSELYCEEVKNPSTGELPAYADPTKNMNRIAHALLD